MISNSTQQSVYNVGYTEHPAKGINLTQGVQYTTLRIKHHRDAVRFTFTENDAVGQVLVIAVGA